MVKLYEITEAQAEAMSLSTALKTLAEEAKLQEELEGGPMERELEGYALDYDTGSPEKGPDGKFKVLDDGDDLEVKEAPRLWRHWSKIYNEDEMMNLSVLEALSLHPKVKEILEKKVADTVGKFKEEASPATKSKYDGATDEVKLAILRNWLKSKGGPSVDGGRKRKTRRRRHLRHTRRR
jgi:hypothetical protein